MKCKQVCIFVGSGDPDAPKKIKRLIFSRFFILYNYLFGTSFSLPPI